jgi:hypothetical protein
MLTEGLPRSYFHQRFVHAVWHIIERDLFAEIRETETVMKVNLEEAISRLQTCPVCSDPLQASSDYPLERFCNSCGDFTVTEVWTTGEVVFAFKMFSDAPSEGKKENPDG